MELIGACDLRRASARTSTPASTTARQHPGLCVRAGGRHPHHLGRGKGSPAYFRGTFSADSNTLTSEWVYPGERLPGNQHQDRQLTSHDTRRPRRPGVMPLRAPRRRPRRRRMEWRDLPAGNHLGQALGRPCLHELQQGTYGLVGWRGQCSSRGGGRLARADAELDVLLTDLVARASVMQPGAGPGPVGRRADSAPFSGRECQPTVRGRWRPPRWPGLSSRGWRRGRRQGGAGGRRW